MLIQTRIPPKISANMFLPFCAGLYSATMVTLSNKGGIDANQRCTVQNSQSAFKSINSPQPPTCMTRQESQNMRSQIDPEKPLAQIWAFVLNHPEPERSDDRQLNEFSEPNLSIKATENIHKGQYCPSHPIQCRRDHRLSVVGICRLRDTNTRDPACRE